jgi:hypothetical protein
MTKAEEKEVIRIYGPDYEEKDIPTYIRNRDEALERETEEGRQEELERQEREKLLEEEISNDLVNENKPDEEE